MHLLQVGMVATRGGAQRELRVRSTDILRRVSKESGDGIRCTVLEESGSYTAGMQKEVGRRGQEVEGCGQEVEEYGQVGRHGQEPKGQAVWRKAGRGLCP